MISDNSSRRMILVTSFLLLLIGTATTAGDGGWITIPHNVKINYELDTTPLEIKTNSAAGSNDVLVLSMFTGANEYAGEILIYFRSPIQYYLTYCSSAATNFPTTLPSSPDKIWRFTLDRTSAGTKLQIHCNDVEVLNALLSDSFCTSPRYKGDGKAYWSRKVEKIEFNNGDTASDQYRSYSACNSKNAGLKRELEQAKADAKKAESENAELKKKNAELKRKLEKAKKSACPGKGVWTVPESLVGKKITGKMVKQWKKDKLEKNVKYLGWFRGVRLTKSLAKYIECFKTVK